MLLLLLFEAKQLSYNFSKYVSVEYFINQVKSLLNAIVVSIAGGGTDESKDLGNLNGKPLWVHAPTAPHNSSLHIFIFLLVFISDGDNETLLKPTTKTKRK